MSKVLLSVIIPCFNHGKFVRECVNSLTNSGMISKMEVIIINDGSNDNNFTKKILDSIVHPKVKIVHQNNQGLAKTRNNAIKISSGLYILPLDADNFVNEDFLLNSIKKLEEKAQIDILYTDRKLFFENGNEELFKPSEIDFYEIALKNKIDACAFYKKTVWEQVNGYSEDMPVMGYEDWDFWLKCLEKKLAFYYLEGVYFHYRVLENSMIHSAIGKRELVKSYILKHRSEFYKNLVFDLLQKQDYKKRKPIKSLLKEIKSIFY